MCLLKWRREALSPQMAYCGGGGTGGSRTTLAAVMAARAPRPSWIRPEAVRAAEAAAREVLRRVEPTEAAERRRQDVIGYLGRLFGTALGCEVIAFGSVPLKSYLPDGDIDITVLGNTALDSTYISDVHSILESEQDSGTELEIKGLQFINAEVKLIKCVIENIVVDISFNQIGGVSTLCFLELVDRKVGKNHLFKRSIMLIKAWCYYESRILGAHHGLLSTYALETLVLYIFNIFHKSLHGPLEALYKFLEYFSKFDWEKYCISLNGPVLLSSLPNLAVELSAINDELLFSKEILEVPFDKLIVLPEVSGGSNINICLKHLNIIDPLKWSNNLGRSVSKGSFYRIRGAFSFGAQKLGQILMLRADLIPTEIFGFFMNTLKRHGRGERSDVGKNDSPEFLLAPEYALGKDAPVLNNSNRSEDENRSPNPHRTSDSYFPGTGFNIHSTYSTGNGNDSFKQGCKDCSAGEDLPPVISFMEQQIYANNKPHILTPSTRTNTLDVPHSCAAESNRSDLHEQKLILSPCSTSNLLDLSGDLDLHLGCLRKIQYHLESMFDGLVQLIQEAFLSGVLDEDSFKIPTESYFSNTDARHPGLLSVSSSKTEIRNLSPVYYSHSTGDICHKSHTGDQVNAVCQQNGSLPSGTHITSNGLTFSPYPTAISENYPVYRFHTTQDLRTYGTGMQSLNNASLFLGTNVLSNALGQFSSPADGSENHNIFGYNSTRNNRVTRGTGSYIPQMSYDTYKERILSEKGRRQREILPNRLFKIKTNQTGHLHQHNSHEVGCSDESNGVITAESTYHIPTNQNSSQQDYSGKIVVPGEGGFALESASTNHATELTQISQPWNVHNNQHGYVCSDNNNMVDNQKPATSESLVRPDNESRELQILHPPEVQICKATASPCIVLPLCGHDGQGNIQESNTCQPSSPAIEVCHPIKTKLDESLQFGSFGPISFSVPCAKFRAVFPILPSIKGPVETPISTLARPQPTATESRSEGFYQLKDEADFPPLQAGSC
ncbi:uncharacterized protein LOC102710836 isoform X3 [Oryza brachyantha]|uniref:uncharacterized protein LOC102710836 isoform X3 n=1 Tax=Oryza brachyantha TaxID=4533 RepID=UPI001ADA3134|nr:uncharacterized protein LOC102710836 isoform X3 [Oryza brachyantha]